MTIAAGGTALALFGAALALGARHAVDPDHLTVIDGIARRNVAERLRLARLGGVLFALGHGMIVTLAAFAAVGLEERWRVPAILAQLGESVAIVILLALGALNLRAAWRAPDGERVATIGWKARLSGSGGDHPLAIVGIGILFGLAVDTLAQAAMLGAAAARIGGTAAVLAAVGCFTLGMLVVGGANGVWMTQMLRSASRRAARASRVMTGVVGLLNLGVGAFALGALLFSAREDAGDGGSLRPALLVVAAGCAAYAVAIGYGAATRPRRWPRAERRLPAD